MIKRQSKQPEYIGWRKEEEWEGQNNVTEVIDNVSLLGEDQEEGDWKKQLKGTIKLAWLDMVKTTGRLTG